MRARRDILRALSDEIMLGMTLVYGNLLLPGILRRQIGYPAGDIAYNAALALVAGACVGFMGVWREIGFRRPASWWTLLWFSPLALEVVDQLSHWHVYAGFGDTATYGLFYLVQSVQMQLIFTGLMVRSLLPLGRWTAAIVPAVLQGLLIAASFTLVPSEDGFIPILLLLAVSTAASGFAYAALRIRTGLLWPLIVADVTSGILYYLTLPPNASPYPLTMGRLLYFSAITLVGLLVGGVALLTARRPESRTTDIVEDRPRANRGRGRWALSCLALAVGATVLMCSLGASVTGIGGGLSVNQRNLPAFQQNSQHPYFAARPGSACDSGIGHWWNDDPEERYTCRDDGLQITQLKFDYQGEAYFAFAGDDQSSAPFWSHDYWVSVDARIVGGELGTCVGLHAHVQDFQGRQTFLACDDGTWSIGRCDLHCDNDVELLSGTLAKPTEHFVLDVYVTDTTMTFLVNGVSVATLHDTTYTSTDQLVLALDGPENATNLPSAVFSNFSYSPVK